MGGNLRGTESGSNKYDGGQRINPSGGKRLQL